MISTSRGAKPAPQTQHSSKRRKHMRSLSAIVLATCCKSRSASSDQQKNFFAMRFCVFLAILGLCSVSVQAQAKVHYIDVGQADAILLEFDKAAVMIDAGAEATNNPIEETHLIDYLNQFFQRRTDLNRTIHTIIISHPH